MNPIPLQTSPGVATDRGPDLHTTAGIQQNTPLHSAILRSIDKIGLLRAVSIFARLSDAELAALAAGLGAHAFARGQTIFQQGDPGDTLYLVVRGQVRVYHASAAGRELTVALFRAG